MGGASQGVPVARVTVTPRRPVREVRPGAQCCMLCGIFVHSLLFFVGFIMLLHTWLVGATLAEDVMQGAERPVGAFAIVLRGILSSFVDVSFLDPVIPTTLSLDMWGFWVPGMLGTFVSITSLLGLATVRGHKSLCAVPYAAFAAVLLMWIVETGHVLTEVVKSEDLAHFPDEGELTEMQHFQKYMFNLTHAMFRDVLTDQVCEVSAEGVLCHSGLHEAVIFETFLQEVCVQTSDLEFDNRVRVCEEHGRRAGFLQQPSPTDEIYCRCRSAMFDLMAAMSKTFKCVSLGFLISALSVIYVAAEPKFRTMGSEQVEVLLFVIVGVVLLSYRLLLFSDAPHWITN